MYESEDNKYVIAFPSSRAQLAHLPKDERLTQLTSMLVERVRRYYRFLFPDSLFSSVVSSNVAADDVPLSNRKVVSSLCVGLAETTNKIGPAFLEGRVEHFANIAVQVLEQKAICQQDPDQDESEDAPEDSAEYDSILISSAGDLVAALATALGADFASGYEKFAPLIMKYYVS